MIPFRLLLARCHDRCLFRTVCLGFIETSGLMGPSVELLPLRQCSWDCRVWDNRHPWRENPKVPSLFPEQFCKIDNLLGYIINSWHPLRGNNRSRGAFTVVTSTWVRFSTAHPHPCMKQQSKSCAKHLILNVLCTSNVQNEHGNKRKIQENSRIALFTRFASLPSFIQ